MRPRIICHMVGSVDGRLNLHRWTAPVSEEDIDPLLDHYGLIADRFQADGWICGRRSMKDFAKGKARACQSDAADLRRTYQAARKGRQLAVAIDPHGKLHYGRHSAEGDHVVAVLGEGVSDSYLAELHEDGVSYLFAGTDGHDMAHAMDVLGSDFGTKTVLLEGGGIVNGAFLKAGLIEEISLLVYSGIDGLVSVPSIFEYAGADDEQPAAGRALRYLSTETLDGGMVWLRYRVEPGSPAALCRWKEEAPTGCEGS